VDLHAEDNKGGGENESKIGEKLERGMSLATAQDGSGPWGHNGSKRTNTVFNHTCNAVWVQRESRLTRNPFPLTLQFIGSVASKPANIAMIAMRAVRRQPEYSFAPSRDQDRSGGASGGGGGRPYPYCPAIFPPPRNDFPLEPKGGEVFPSTGISTQNKTEANSGSHVDPTHHMQELDECHCKA
jgi:hypothetical protein